MAPGGRALALAALPLALALAGCLAPPQPLVPASLLGPALPLQYDVREPDLDLPLLEHVDLVQVLDAQIHVRIVRPDVPEPVPVVVQFTPYTAPGRSTLVEPMVGPLASTLVQQLARRGFAYAWADVRGTGDSSGCLDLRGSLDIRDAWELTEFLGTQPWSNGKVGFIGASYPGSEAHIAAIAGNPHLGGVVPVVASTSFYSYHHKDGVPYANHVGTNTGYTQNALMPTKNVDYANWLERTVREPFECDTLHHNLMQLDQSGTYDGWWHDRNLRWRVGQVQVPVLMAQGLADWNVKPDHIAAYWNDLAVRKTLIAGQWGHQFPLESNATYGAWWELVTAFFDETLRGQATGLFAQDRAYVQDNAGGWHVYASWPPREASWAALNLTWTGLTTERAPEGMAQWEAKPHGDFVGAPLGPEEQVVLESEPLPAAMHVSGVLRLNLTIVSTAGDVHLVAVLEAAGEAPQDPASALLGAQGGWVRENYGYLNPTYRDGVDKPQRLIPNEPTPVTITMYPQEDVFPEGARLRLVLRSVDDGHTIPAFDRATIQVQLAGERPGQLWLPLSDNPALPEP